MQKFVSNQVINGTWGEVWLDDEYIGEVVSCKGEVSVSYTDVSMVRSLTAGKKMTKLEGKGSIKLHHVRSNISKMISDKIKRGQTPDFKIITKLSDPDALGVERVVFYRCKFDKAILMDWEVQKNTEESYSFTFEDWDYLDNINA
nr:MAG TPA: tail tube protein [Caudoviricetes sp.]